MRFISLAILIAGIATTVNAEVSSTDLQRDVRRILSDHCFACHGPDEAERQADLRLDDMEGLSTVVVAGEPASSELIARVESDDQDTLMPPPDFHKPLTKQQIQTLKNWVSSGAEIASHWSFVPPVKVDDAPRDAVAAIDYFIDARIDSAGLTANPIADRRTLLRRVCLDLTGLPPRRDQIDRFLADESPGAYQRLVDRLLQSHHFGEHVGRYWLDLVRYGDTHGLHLDNYREMWPYRDWVIDAFNANLPYDEFVKRQLAGDLLPQATIADKIASGFNRLNVTTNEGGSITEEVFARNVIDRTDAFGTIFLGLSTGCAVCHDHKFDPLTMMDYYSLSGYFNSLDGNAMDGNVKDHAPAIPVPTAQQSAELAEIERSIEEIKQAMVAPISAVDQAQLAWQQSVLNPSQILSIPVIPSEVKSKANVEMKITEDGTVELIGVAADKDTVTIIAPLPNSEDSDGHWPTVQLDALPDPATDRVGASPNGNVVLTEVTLETTDDQQEGQWSVVPIVRAFADVEQTNGPFAVSYAIDGKENDGEGWAVAGHQQTGGRKLQLATPSLVNEGDHPRLRIELKFLSKFAKHQFRRLRLSLRTAPPAGEVKPEMVERIKAASGSEEIDTELRDYYRTEHCLHPDWLVLVDQLEGANKSKEKLIKSFATTLIWKELAKPRQAHILNRGQYDQPGDPVDRATPEFLPPLPTGAPNNRLGLAEWLVDPAHPLTARVAVNRFWQQIFGTGLVVTSEDFGSQGQPPSHGRLLDWLAVDFQENNWDIKRLIKNLVMSSAYRRSSAASSEMLSVDPRNRLLARGPRHRLDAEVLRDQALALSGLLVDQRGGPSVKPPQPDGLWKAVGYSGSNTVKFTPDSGNKVYRRSVYTFWKRTAPPPQMSTFDAPSRESCTARRERTNTPLQALLLMNEQQYVEAAYQLGKRTRQQAELATDLDRINWLFETVTCRLPNETEHSELAKLLADATDHYRAHPAAAKQLCGSQDPVAGAWTILASTVMNLDEVVTK